VKHPPFCLCAHQINFKICICLFLANSSENDFESCLYFIFHLKAAIKRLLIQWFLKKNGKILRIWILHIKLDVFERKKKKVKFDPFEFSGAITLCLLHFKFDKQKVIAPENSKGSNFTFFFFLSKTSSLMCRIQICKSFTSFL
jgi:hypothetical protein